MQQCNMLVCVIRLALVMEKSQSRSGQGSKEPYIYIDKIRYFIRYERVEGWGWQNPRYNMIKKKRHSFFYN